MKGELTTKLVTVNDLKDRWSMSLKTVYRIVANYRAILEPVRIGREYRFEPDNIRKFEEQMRVVRED